MGLRIQEGGARNGIVETHVEPDSIDDELDLFIYTCDALHKTGKVDYWVEGFGDRAKEGGWYIDTSYLSSVLGDIGRAIGALSHDEVTRLSFYEQIHQREIVCRPLENDRVKVECETQLENWAPEPTHYVQPLSGVLTDMMNVVVGYLRAVCLFLPAFTKSSVLRGWVREPGPRLAVLSHYPELGRDVFGLQI